MTAIRELFGIEITCNKNTNSYYIANSRELKDSSGFKGWLLDALSLNNQLEESSQLKDRILLEENPSGRELLPTILEAMRDNKMLTFSYKPYWVEDDHISNLYHVEPYALKVFKRRWYLLGKYGDSPLKVYALDRILDIDIEFESFTLPADFDAESFFSSCFGIIVSDEDPQTIKLKVDAFQSNYLRSLPLHPSQKETERTESPPHLRFRPGTVNLARDRRSAGSKRVARRDGADREKHSEEEWRAPTITQCNSVKTFRETSPPTANHGHKSHNWPRSRRLSTWASPSVSGWRHHRTPSLRPSATRSSAGTPPLSLHPYH